MEVLLFDVTTLYFESIHTTELQDFGYSKDGKFNETQVVLAVLSSREGLPLAYEVFPSNTGETKRESLSGLKSLPPPPPSPPDKGGIRETPLGLWELETSSL